MTTLNELPKLKESVSNSLIENNFYQIGKVILSHLEEQLDNENKSGGYNKSKIEYLTKRITEIKGKYGVK